ncbi:cation-binding protein [Caballeronia udeis]|uniref:Cation-binding protein n=1 Tax=Caballeronia udeis TaxID=1232866 RepID=A0A158H322_9BURK|nr:hypothetical protein [Caballeronia udeis]SAL38170.1 cation-binding protein [Caballeronia udeis]
MEHFLVKTLIENLTMMKASDEGFDATKVLIESVTHHLEEEESELFPGTAQDRARSREPWRARRHTPRGAAKPAHQSGHAALIAPPGPVRKAFKNVPSRTLVTTGLSSAMFFLPRPPQVGKEKQFFAQDPGDMRGFPSAPSAFRR